VSTLSEARSKQLLARYGVPVLDERTARDADSAASAAAAIGFPVVLKVCGDRIAHKTERGLVRLGLRDDAAVLDAAEELLAATRPQDGPVELLVAPMVRASRELIAGMHTDAQFGPCVMLGIGGVLAEAIADVAFRLVPLTPVDAEEMLDDLATGSLLEVFRGEPAVDRGAVASVLLALSRVAEAEPEVRSIDVNPLMIVDGRPVAVDALVEVAE
jgi:acetyl-CoA synthetase (ADP-forming)